MPDKHKCSTKNFIVRGGNYVWCLKQVHDGDTIELTIPGAYLPKVLQKISVRIYGIDTPELRSPDATEKAAGEKARDFVVNAVNKAQKLELQVIDWDKYGGRVLAVVYIDGVDLTKMLIEGNYGRPYFGDKKQEWEFPINNPKNAYQPPKF